MFKFFSLVSSLILLYFSSMLPDNSSPSLHPTHIATVLAINQIEADGFKLCGHSGHCQTKVFPSSTQFHLVEDRTGTLPGLWVCSDCNDNYLSKVETQFVSRKYFMSHAFYKCNQDFIGNNHFKEADGIFPSISKEASSSTNCQQIHHDVSAAQHRGTLYKHLSQNYS